MSKRFLTESRSNENFTPGGLVSLTGQDQKDWRRYVVKELLDNALEAADETDEDIGTPEITVSLTYEHTIGLRDETEIQYFTKHPRLTTSEA